MGLFDAISNAAVGTMNLAGNLYSGHRGRQQQNKELRASREEAELARQHDRESAAQANEWSIEQWNRENEYNSPAAMIARGVNPDLAMAGNTAGNAASSPAVTSAAPSPVADIPSSAGRKNVGDALSESANFFASMKMNDALIDKTNAETKKVEAETAGQTIDNEYASKIKDGELELNAARINNLKGIDSLNEKQRSVLDAQISKIEEETNSLKQGIIESLERVKDLKVKQANDRIRLQLEKNLSRAQLKNIAADTGLKYSQIKQMRDTLPYLIEQMAYGAADSEQSSRLKYQQTQTEKLRQFGIEIQNGQLVLNGELLLNDVKSVRSYSKVADIPVVGDVLRGFTVLVESSLGKLVKPR